MRSPSPETRVQPPPLEAVRTPASGPPPLRRFEGSPAILADLMFASLLGPGGGLVSLDPSGENALLALRQGNITTMQLAVSGDVAAAAIARIAKMTALDPLAGNDELTETRSARLAAQLGDDPAEFLVTLGATPLGMSAEIRLLSLRGQPIERHHAAQLKRCMSCGTYQPALRERCEMDGGVLRVLRDDPTPGGTIGPYRLLSLLGRGGMGEVFAAEHALIERSVAIKVLRASLASDRALESRFLFEARATSRLRHPNVVSVTDYGVLPGGSPYIVMERLDGDSLERRLGSSTALEPGLALRIAHAAALGLDAAHEGGVVHNDLKPSNVILLRESTDDAPRLKLIDFGAASLAGAKEHDDMLVGTLAYMAPERISGEPSDVRSDTYSMGIMLYRMLSGRLPYDASDDEALFTAHLEKPPRPLASPFGVLPSRVTRIVARALAKKPIERYQTMKQMVIDIESALTSFDAAGWRKWLP